MSPIVNLSSIGRSYAPLTKPLGLYMTFALYSNGTGIFSSVKSLRRIILSKSLAISLPRAIT